MLDVRPDSLLCCAVMTEHDHGSPTPGELLQLKDAITQRWRQLPPEHQATMTLVLFQQTLEGEYGLWLRSAFRMMDRRDVESPFRFLPVVQITRTHLVHTELAEEEIGQLDDEDLMFISQEIVRHYTNDVFWEELEFLARLTLAEKSSR